MLRHFATSFQSILPSEYRSLRLLIALLFMFSFFLSHAKSWKLYESMEVSLSESSEWSENDFPA
jgi:hypothetical protein